MCPRPMSWPEASADRLGVDVSSRAAEFAQSLEQHVQDGLSPQLALDLALNELVVAATAVTHASAAALALARGNEMVCRATTGDHAPDLGVPINTHSGLSGACIRSRRAQHCTDTESDERVDSVASRRLGIRSILVVPVLDGADPVGLIEVFSRQPSAFAEADQAQLQGFALDCVKLQRLSLEIAQRPPHKLEKAEPRPSIDFSAQALSNETGKSAAASESVLFGSTLLRPDLTGILDSVTRPSAKARSRTDTWTLVLATLVTLVTVGFAFLIGFRTGWLHTFSRSPTRLENPQPVDSEPASASTAPLAPEPKVAKQPVSAPAVPRPSIRPLNDGLIVYEQGKVIFPPPSTSSSPGQQEKSSAGVNPRVLTHVWLAPDVAEARLRDRVEPDYPAEARAAHLSGDVTLQILVRKDGSVASVRTIKGDPVLAQAAAAAVRNWRYEPYRLKDRPKEFQTDVALRFSLPKELDAP